MSDATRAEVCAAAVADAKARGLPEAAIAELWDRLVEASIAYELTEWDRTREPAPSAPIGG